MRLRLLIAAIAIATVMVAKPQDSIPTYRPVTSSYSVEYGWAHLADTYLTPLHYRGWHTGVKYQREQAMKHSPEKWSMQLRLGVDFDRTQNPAKNATILNGEVSASWAMMRRWQVPVASTRVTVGVGPALSLTGGVLYLSRNGNNPASAKAAITIDATAFAAWKGKIGRLPLTLRYQPTMPVTGAFFSPDYGQLYYQIYMGDRDKLAHAAWPGNYFKLDNLITADLHLGNTSLRIGYHNSILSSKVNNIVTQNITHALVIGITTEWISLRPSSKAIKAEIISNL